LIFNHHLSISICQAHSSLGGLPAIQSLIGHNAQQPRAKRLVRPERVQRSIGAHKSFLGRVGRFMLVLGD
jgi:hypothetical protein